MILAHVVVGDCVKSEGKQMPPIKDVGGGLWAWGGSENDMVIPHTHHIQPFSWITSHQHQLK
jgi:uncharacterized spore protein YtfJ